MPSSPSQFIAKAILITCLFSPSYLCLKCLQCKGPNCISQPVLCPETSVCYKNVIFSHLGKEGVISDRVQMGCMDLKNDNELLLPLNSSLCVPHPHVLRPLHGVQCLCNDQHYCNEAAGSTFKKLPVSVMITSTVILILTTFEVMINAFFN